MPAGRNCKASAMRNSAYCYHHRLDKARRRPLRSRDIPFEIEPIVDASSIQCIGTQILQAMAANRLSKDKAAVMIQALQTVVAGFKLPPNPDYDPTCDPELDPTTSPFVPGP